MPLGRARAQMDVRVQIEASPDHTTYIERARKPSDKMPHFRNVRRSLST